ncbi:MFS transporter [Herbiconiux sp. A18JL235]|uniref:MFS transporter n=1 Tax=Herbiconiux sp. A18JL235 TaxID=3152363 RepID=A0AB39BKD1_9MICO
MTRTSDRTPGRAPGPPAAPRTAPVPLARSVERRFLLLTATRWLPVGLVFGLTVLLPLERGLSLAEVGVLLSVQGFVVLALELPTGGLADALGRRPVLVASGVVAVLSSTLFLVADSFWMFAVALAGQGVFRALDSGPLEAWYVDALHAADPAAPVERGLSRAATVLGVAIAGSALAGGGLVAWAPLGAALSALVLPYLVATTLTAAHAVLIAVLVSEPRRGAGTPAAAGSLAGAGDAEGPGSPEGPAAGARRPAALAALRSLGRGMREVPRSLAAGGRLLTSSPVLRALVLVEVFWSVAMIAFETFTPVSLAGMLGGESSAGAVFGPAAAAAWALFAAGSTLAGFAARRIGVAWTAIAARILNGAFVVVMGLVAGPLGLVAAFWLAYLAHGAGGPMHATLLHREAGPQNRAVVLSINSVVAGGAYSLGLLAMAPLADAVGTAPVFVAAGLVSTVGALLYLPALRRERRMRGGERS